MSQTIYPSLLPSVKISPKSIFTHLFAPDGHGNIGGYPGSSPAFIDAETSTTISRATLRSLALSLAYGLTNPCGPTLPLSKGDTVLFLSPNSIVYPVATFGIVAAGLRCTFANSAYTANELKHQWADSGAKVILAHPSLVPTVAEMFKNGLGWSDEEVRKRVIVAATEWLTGAKDEGTTQFTNSFTQLSALLNHGSLASEVEFVTGKGINETVYLCYSSGTTGKPKGVETTHKNIVSLITLVAPAYPTHTINDVVLGMLPFYHIYGMVKLLHFPLLNGTPVVIMPRFSIDSFCTHVARYKVTIALVVPPMLLLIAKSSATTQHDLRSLQVLFSGAAPLGSTLVNAVRARLHGVGANVVITQGYGLTETSPTTHVLPVGDSLRKVGSIGVLLPNLEARLVLEDDITDAKEGEPGELWIRGPSVMKGYLNNKSATRKSITSDGWFKTGDVTIRDGEGFYTIVDRKKELIKYKGFQVPPAELESVLLENEAIADVAVIGVDSRVEETELPRAYIVPTNPGAFKTDEEKAAFGRSIQEWITTRVARHKYLRGGVGIVDVIPKSAAGKILRRELRELAKRETAAVKAKL